MTVKARARPALDALVHSVPQADPLRDVRETCSAFIGSRLRAESGSRYGTSDLPMSGLAGLCDR